MKTRISATISLVPLMATLSAFQYTSLNVFAISTYQSGFYHGAIDGRDNCLHPHGCHWYILEPGNGFKYHTWEFVRGYVNGFCMASPYTSSDDDKAAFDCRQGPVSASWVSEH